MYSDQNCGSTENISFGQLIHNFDPNPQHLIPKLESKITKKLNTDPVSSF